MNDLAVLPLKFGESETSKFNVRPDFEKAGTCRDFRTFRDDDGGGFPYRGVKDASKDRADSVTAEYIQPIDLFSRLSRQRQ